MSSYLKFLVLWAVTGSPVAALLILLAVWAVADWFAFGFGRKGWRLFNDFRRSFALARQVDINPHDRKARTDLGEILLGQRRYAKAIEMLRPVLEADPSDKLALFLMGQACLGAGCGEQGELFLQTLREAEPEYRGGCIELVIGRDRLRRGDAAGAKAALESYLVGHKSSVEGYYLLSKARMALGDEQGARAAREQTWREYRSSLPFQQRMDRLWAWRVKPWRPVVYGLGLVVGLMVLGAMLQSVNWDDPNTRAAAYYGADYLDQ